MGKKTKRLTTNISIPTLKLVDFTVSNFRNITERWFVLDGEGLDVLWAKDRSLIDAIDFITEYVQDPYNGKDLLYTLGGVQNIIYYWGNATSELQLKFKLEFVDDLKETFRYEVELQPLHSNLLKVTRESLYAVNDGQHGNKFIEFADGKGEASIGIAPNGTLEDGALALNAYGLLDYYPVNEVYKHIKSWRIYDLDLRGLKRQAAGYFSKCDVKAGRNIASVMFKLYSEYPELWNEFMKMLKGVFPRVCALGNDTVIHDIRFAEEIDGAITISVDFNKNGETCRIPLKMLPNELLYSIAILALLAEAASKNKKPGLIAFKEPFAYIDERYASRMTGYIRKFAGKHDLNVILHTKDYGSISDLEFDFVSESER